MNRISSEKLTQQLPPLILLEDYRGNWEMYLEAIYRFYKRDFIEHRVRFRGLPVFARYEPSYELKGATFWHLISNGVKESERLPDLRRCERLCWPKAIIEQSPSAIKIWETIRPWKGQQQKRINLALEDFSYLVVLGERARGFDLVTAYPVDENWTRRKKQNEYEIFERQKKEGSAV